MDYSSNSITFLRRILRRTKLHYLIYKYLNKNRYEEKVNEVVKEKIKKGDIIWDVGSNVGIYTSIFSKLVKKNGRVYSFEPHPKTFSILKKKKLKNVTYVNLGLSNNNKYAYFTNYNDKKNVINHIVNTKQFLKKTIRVKINTGDFLVTNKICKTPNFLKIDVEGHELFVLEGMENILSDKNLKYILIEVHNEALDKLGFKNGAKKITNILLKNNFSIKWISLSHIFASKF